MKKKHIIIISVVLIVAVVGGIFAVNAVISKPKKPEGPVRLLMIGNSFSWNAFTYIRQIAEAEGVELVVANLYYSGCSLEKHYDFLCMDSSDYYYSCSWAEEQTGYSLKKALADQEWDYISLQQVSGYAGDYDSYQPYLHSLVTYLRENEPGAEIIWHQTWAYQKTSDHSDFPKYDKSQKKMWKAINSTSKKAAKAENIKYIVPSGKAFQNARATAIGDNLNTDGYHANDMGCYLAGYCFFSTVTGVLPSDNAYKLPDVDEATTELLKTAVTDAVEEYGYVD